MKKSFYFFLRVFLLSGIFIILAGELVKGQDIIVKRNGDEIRAKVEEVLDTEIRYRKFENLTGPLYSIPKAEIFMIRYENGSKDVFDEPKPAVPTPPAPVYTQPPRPAVKSITDKDIRPAKNASRAGYLLTIPILGLGFTAGAIEDEPEISLPIGGAATLIAAVGIPLVYSGSNRTSKATGVGGNTGLRTSGWILYGLTLADAITLIGLGFEYDTGGPLTWTVAGLGALTSVLFAMDAGQVAREAESLQSAVHISPAFYVIRDNAGNKFNTIGLTINF